MKGIQVLARMAEEDNKTLKMAPLSNIKRMQSGKNGWGEVTIAIDNETIRNLTINKLVGGLFVADAKEFNKVEEENS